MSDHFGVSFSLHRCSELGIDKKAVLSGSLKDLGFRRFRLMSYWNIHERTRGKYNFDELDWQLDMIGKHKGSVSLCLGKRQPRWPECHMPDWATKLTANEWYQELYTYIEVVVKRYRNHPALGSWQLENEALLREFGHCVDQDYNHSRLSAELKIVKNLDTKHPVIMTLSDSWGLPVRGPKPDAYAISLYRKTIDKNGSYSNSKRPAAFYRVRSILINVLKNRQAFIHELQAEPWLSNSITDTSVDEQVAQMSPEDMKAIFNYALSTKMNPIDMWGLEWWYWMKETQSRPEYWHAVQNLIKQNHAAFN